MAKKRQQNNTNNYDIWNCIYDFPQTVTSIMKREMRDVHQICSQN